MANNVVWKFSFPLNELTASFTNVIHVPKGAKFLYCAKQRERDICFWYLVDPSQPTEEHGFQVFGTGHGEIRAGLTYVTTLLFVNGDLVIHVFETEQSFIEKGPTVEQAARA